VSNFLQEIYQTQRSTDCMCGLCQGEIDNKIVQKTMPDSDDKKFIGDLKRKEQKVVLNKTIENLRKINKSWLCVSPDSDQDVFFSSKGIFIRKVVMMLDYYYERSELHQVLQKCLARAYLIRMENHYQRANAHFRS
ncbi:uncharacterized protein METZ01_LOCUS332350, partial [marine metagenome]